MPQRPYFLLPQQMLCRAHVFGSQGARPCIFGSLFAYSFSTATCSAAGGAKPWHMSFNSRSACWVDSRQCRAACIHEVEVASCVGRLQHINPCHMRSEAEFCLVYHAHLPQICPRPQGRSASLSACPARPAASAAQPPRAATALTLIPNLAVAPCRRRRPAR